MHQRDAVELVTQGSKFPTPRFESSPGREILQDDRLRRCLFPVLHEVRRDVVAKRKDDVI